MGEIRPRTTFGIMGNCIGAFYQENHHSRVFRWCRVLLHPHYWWRATLRASTIDGASRPEMGRLSRCFGGSPWWLPIYPLQEPEIQLSNQSKPPKKGYYLMLLPGKGLANDFWSADFRPVFSARLSAEGKKAGLARGLAARPNPGAHQAGRFYFISGMLTPETVSIGGMLASRGLNACSKGTCTYQQTKDFNHGSSFRGAIYGFRNYS